MIDSFGDNRTQDIFDGIAVKKLSIDLQRQAWRRLQYIDAAKSLEELQITASNRLERKKGDLKDFYAIWVNRQWRIIFRWHQGRATDVQLIDYH
jgi:proteic killer suppression protein